MLADGAPFNFSPFDNI